ncbi:MAG: citryl-CoA lyase [Bauldia sp.]
MLIGKPGPGLSALCHATADRIEIRGRDLTADLMGHLTFTEYFFFLMTGSMPKDEQRFFLDLLLVAIAEHGLVPTAIAARMTYDAAPDSLQGAVAAGILGAGTVILGTAELCGKVLVEAREKVEAGGDPDEVVTAIAMGIAARGEKMPGFGHPIHKEGDPRTARIFDLADRHKVSATHVDLARRFVPAVKQAAGKALPMNVSMPIAAVLLDLDFPAAMIKGIPLLARTAGLLAHLAEEQARPIGFLMASKAEDAIGYDGKAPT